MDAQITGRTTELVGLSVVDNDDEEHVIDIQKENGGITGHQQDGYPDKAAKRSFRGNENVDQARRYAKYYVDQETNHNTLPWDLDADQFEAVRQALRNLSITEIETNFGESSTIV